MSFKPMVRTGKDPKWYGNSLAFATREEAQYSADELMSRWLLVVEAGVEESDEPVNYRIDWDMMQLVAVPKGGGGVSINIRDVIVQIDWAQLSVQKRWLEAQDTVEAEGLIHLLDVIQDAAVDEGLADENEVFF